MKKQIHIIGGGISGLAAASFACSKKFKLSEKYKIDLHEGSRHLGGRCRSYLDKDLNLVVDNGNHLILSSNISFLELCKIIKSEDTLAYYGTNYQFFDFKSKNFWNLDLEKFKLPFGFFKKKNRVPDTKIIDYFSFLRLLFVKKSDTVGQIVSKKNSLFSSFWEPFTVGVLNTRCVDASAFLLKKVLLETFFKGPNFSGIIQPKDSWDKTLISPARDFLMKKNVNLNFNDALRKIVIKDNLINELIFKEKKKKFIRMI